MSAFCAAVINLFVLAVPAHLLAYYPFRTRLRFSTWKVLTVVGLFQTAHLLLYGYAVWQGGNGRAAMYGFSVVYMAIYFFCVQDDRFKLLFLYLFVMDYEMILWGISVFIEAHFFYYPGMDFASWTSVLLNLIVLAVSAPFIIPFFSTAKDKVFSMDAPMFWRSAWMIPASTTAIVIMFTGRFTGESVRSFGFLFSRVLLVLCVFVVYSILLDALDGIRCQAALREPVWEDGRLRSTKHEGFGTGTRIVRETAERSGGAAEFTYKEGVFFASVFLYG